MATKTPAADSTARVEAARAFAIEAARLAANTRCHHVVVLDVRELSPVTDFFVLATGTSPRQMRSVCDDIEELAGPKDFSPISRSGYGADTWVLLDFVDVIVHLFNEEARQFYDLDSLWGDAKRIDWQPAEPASKGAQKPTM